MTTDLVRGASGERKLERLLGVMQACAGDAGLAVNERTFARELRHADRNRATAYLMRAEGMLDGDVEELLALYLHQCSVQVTCAQLAVMGGHARQRRRSTPSPASARSRATGSATC